MIDDAEQTSFHITERRRARAGKRCVECRRVIEKGEAYYYESGVGDGEWFHYATCQHCQIAKEWLIQTCDGFVYGQVQEDIEEHIEELHQRHAAPLSLLRFLVGLRRKWRGYRNNLLPIPRLPSPMSME